MEELVNASVARMSISDTLKDVKDIERLSGKISNGNFLPKDCKALAGSLNALPSLKFQLFGFSSDILRQIDKDLLDMKPLADLLDATICDEPPALMKDGGYIRTGFNEELDELRAIGNNAKKVVEDLAERERERTGIKTLKIGYNRVFGYYTTS